MKTKKFTDEEMEEFTKVFATNYYLTQETHSSFASALGRYQSYFGDLDRMYDFPLRLDTVTGADIQRLAKVYLKNFRLAVIYDRSKFEDAWATKFVEKFIEKGH